MWSIGVILLSLFSKRFPFFNSTDDADAIIELTYIFGVKLMKQAAVKLFSKCDHDSHPLYLLDYPLERVFDTNIPTLPNERVPWTDLLSLFLSSEEIDLIPKEGLDLLDRLLCLDPRERITATEALLHPFLATC
jgi:cell division control protein 7